jgi:putative ABC transport system substrate-binding protein
VLKSATSTIPIVMPGFDDPVGEGIVQSLARPGGNITGMTFQSVELTGKQLELLREVVPKGTVAILRDQSSTGLSAWRAAQTAALARAWRLLPLEVREAGELDAAFQAATRAKAAALLVLGGPLLDPQFRRVTDLASRGLLPSMHRFRYQVEAGGLMSYGPDLVDLWRQAATFVNKILKGANPADLPVEQPTKLELVINMKTAAALGVAIPQSVLLRADRVLQ